MTDRNKGLVVTLDQDIRTDDLRSFIDAIRMMRHVVSVEPVLADIDDHINRSRIRGELIQELWDVLHPEREKR